MSKNICVSTPLYKRQVAMAPDSCGDRVVVVSSPYKSHTQSSSTIQLGQFKLYPFAATLGPAGWVKKSDLGQNSTPHPLSSFVLQPCSFGSHCAGWVTRSVSISIIPPYNPVVRFRGLCFCVQHAQTAEELLPSSVVEAPTATVGYNFSFHWQRYSPTRGDTGVAKRRISDNEGSTCEVLFVSLQQVRVQCS